MAMVLVGVIFILNGFTTYAKGASNASNISESVTYGDGYVTECIEIQTEKGVVVYERTTYKNNTSISKVVENGQETTFNQTIDYQELINSLKSETSLKKAPRGGLEYRYLTTFVDNDRLTPENGNYANVLSVVSAALSPYNAKASLIAAIASMIVSGWSSPHTCWLTITRVYYEVYDDTGTFLGYYYLEYTVDVEEMVNGVRMHTGSETETYTTTEIF